MLSEIFCEKFISNNKQRGKIALHKGLNVVLGENNGANSIGKSTFLLAIDFAFGGETYAKKDIIISNIGHHEICFCFEFNNEKFYFSRNTEKPNEVCVCDENYKRKEEIEVLKIDKYKKWLAEKYELNPNDISFRQVVGSYFRIYGKSNFDEEMPLASYSGEPQKDSLLSLLKLYKGYKPIAEYNKEIEEQTKIKEGFVQANQYKVIDIPLKKDKYKENQNKIEELKKELELLEKKGKQELLNNDADQLSIGAELKTQYDNLSRKKRQLWARYYSLKEDKDAKKIATSEDLSELSKFFPNVNMKLINNVEHFHFQLSQILKDEFSDAIKRTLQEIDVLSKELLKVENELNNLDIPLQISQKTLKSYASIQGQITSLEKSNELYLKKKELEKNISNLRKNYENMFLEQAEKITSKINEEIEKLNSFIYGNNIEAPVLTISKSNSYTYGTPSDDGTGTNNKNLILLDFAALNLTCLPVVAHDTILFKHIGQDAMGKILEIYKEYDKQAFIAIDEANKYNQKSQEIIDEEKVILLSKGGNELYGLSWDKKVKENEK